MVIRPTMIGFNIVQVGSDYSRCGIKVGQCCIALTMTSFSSIPSTMI